MIPLHRELTIQKSASSTKPPRGLESAFPAELLPRKGGNILEMHGSTASQVLHTSGLQLEEFLWRGGHDRSQRCLRRSGNEPAAPIAHAKAGIGDELRRQKKIVEASGPIRERPVAAEMVQPSAHCRRRCTCCPGGQRRGDRERETGVRQGRERKQKWIWSSGRHLRERSRDSIALCFADACPHILQVREARRCGSRSGTRGSFDRDADALPGIYRQKRLLGRTIPASHNPGFSTINLPLVDHPVTTPPLRSSMLRFRPGAFWFFTLRGIEGLNAFPADPRNSSVSLEIRPFLVQASPIIRSQTQGLLFTSS